MPKKGASSTKKKTSTGKTIRGREIKATPPMMQPMIICLVYVDNISVSVAVLVEIEVTDHPVLAVLVLVLVLVVPVLVVPVLVVPVLVVPVLVVPVLVLLVVVEDVVVVVCRGHTLLSYVITPTEVG